MKHAWISAIPRMVSTIHHQNNIGFSLACVCHLNVYVLTLVEVLYLNWFSAQLQDHDSPENTLCISEAFFHFHHLPTLSFLIRTCILVSLKSSRCRTLGDLVAEFRQIITMLSCGPCRRWRMTRLTPRITDITLGRAELTRSDLSL